MFFVYPRYLLLFGVILQRFMQLIFGIRSMPVCEHLSSQTYAPVLLSLSFNEDNVRRPIYKTY